jgi:hypothetical protein
VAAEQAMVEILAAVAEAPVLVDIFMKQVKYFLLVNTLLL